MQQSLASSDYEFLRVFRFGSERAWDDDAAVSDAAVGEVLLLGDIHNSRQVFDAALSAAPRPPMRRAGCRWAISGCRTAAGGITPPPGPR